jgi:hypothetical protein
MRSRLFAIGVALALAALGEGETEKAAPPVAVAP